MVKAVALLLVLPLIAAVDKPPAEEVRVQRAGGAEGADPQCEAAAVDTEDPASLLQLRSPKQHQQLQRKKTVRSEKWCYHGWEVPKSCAANFTYDGIFYIGCTTKGSTTGSAWCSHDTTYNGGYEHCSMCDLPCTEKDFAYNPDMPGQDRTEAQSSWWCRERCKAVDGCAHFTFHPDGGCHVHDASAIPEEVFGVITGPPTCVNITDLPVGMSAMLTKGVLEKVATSGRELIAWYLSTYVNDTLEDPIFSEAGLTIRAPDSGIFRPGDFEISNIDVAIHEPSAASLKVDFSTLNAHLEYRFDAGFLGSFEGSLDIAPQRPRLGLLARLEVTKEGQLHLALPMQHVDFSGDWVTAEDFGLGSLGAILPLSSIAGSANVGINEGVKFALMHALDMAAVEANIMLRNESEIPTSVEVPYIGATVDTRFLHVGVEDNLATSGLGIAVSLDVLDQSGSRCKEPFPAFPYFTPGAPTDQAQINVAVRVLNCLAAAAWTSGALNLPAESGEPNAIVMDDGEASPDSATFVGGIAKDVPVFNMTKKDGLTGVCHYIWKLSEGSNLFGVSEFDVTFDIGLDVHTVKNATRTSFRPVVTRCEAKFEQTQVSTFWGRKKKPTKSSNFFLTTLSKQACDTVTEHLVVPDIIIPDLPVADLIKEDDWTYEGKDLFISLGHIDIEDGYLSATLDAK